MHKNSWRGHNLYTIKCPPCKCTDWGCLPPFRSAPQRVCSCPLLSAHSPGREGVLWATSRRRCRSVLWRAQVAETPVVCSLVSGFLLRVLGGASCATRVHSLLFLWGMVSVWMYAIHLPAEGIWHVSSFWLLRIKLLFEHLCSSLCVNIRVDVLFFWVNVRSGIAESYGRCEFGLVRNCQAVFLSGSANLVSSAGPVLLPWDPAGSWRGQAFLFCPF